MTLFTALPVAGVFFITDTTMMSVRRSLSIEISDCFLGKTNGTHVSQIVLGALSYRFFRVSCTEDTWSAVRNAPLPSVALGTLHVQSQYSVKPDLRLLSRGASIYCTSSSGPHHSHNPTTVPVPSTRSRPRMSLPSHLNMHLLKLQTIAYTTDSQQ